MAYLDKDTILDYPGYIFGDDMADICAPLFGAFPINSFTYGRRYSDGGLLLLTTQHEWSKYHMAVQEYPLLFTGNKVNSWASTMVPKTIEDAGSFGIYNGVLLEKNNPGYVEVLEFASPDPRANPLPFCCDKTMLNKFFLYFKEKVAKYIPVLEKDLLYLPESKFFSLVDNYEISEELQQLICPKKVTIKGRSGDVLLTSREYDVLSLMADKHSMKEVAEILKLSPRTVEGYLCKAKEKTGVFTSKQLLDSFKRALF